MYQLRIASDIPFFPDHRLFAWHFSRLIFLRATGLGETQQSLPQNPPCWNYRRLIHTNFRSSQNKKQKKNKPKIPIGILGICVSKLKSSLKVETKNKRRISRKFQQVFQISVCLHLNHHSKLLSLEQLKPQTNKPKNIINSLSQSFSNLRDTRTKLSIE